VIDGELMLVRHSKSGRQIILQRTRSGFFAEASVESRSYHCDAVARAKSRTYALPMEAFRQALARDPAFQTAWMQHLAEEIRRLRAQCERLVLPSAQERIVHFIESEGSGGAIELDGSLKAWALDLGLTHEALYRALARMAQSGKLARTALRMRLTVPREQG
jgi:CRP-like cAMP-binding protein